MTRSRRLVARTSALLAAVALTVAGVTLATPAAADTVPLEGAPLTVAADSLPTVQIDGVAWQQGIAGSRVFVGGDFANARPAGAAAKTNLVPRANLLAYDLATGKRVKEVSFPTDVALKNTYLNDVRFDLRQGKAGIAYITDSSVSGPGAIIVVDLQSGESWRKLSGDRSTAADPAFVPVVEGETLAVVGGRGLRQHDRRPAQPHELEDLGQVAQLGPGPVGVAAVERRPAWHRETGDRGRLGDGDRGQAAQRVTGGEDQDLVLDGQRRRRCVQAVEVRGHGRQRLLVRPGLLDLVDEALVADPQAEEEPPTVLVRQPRVLGCALVGRVHPDVEDAGGDEDMVSRFQQRADAPKHLAVAPAVDPDRAVSPSFQLRRRVLRTRLVQLTEGLWGP